MTMITPSYLGETIEYSSLHACRSTLEDPTRRVKTLRFTAPAVETSPLLSFGHTEALGETPWCILEISSEHRMAQIMPTLRAQGRKVFGKKAGQIFAPINADGELTFGYIFARAATPALARKLSRIRGVGEMSAVCDDEGTFKYAVQVPHADVCSLIAKHKPEARATVQMGDFVEILAGEAKGYCGTVSDFRGDETRTVEVNFPTGRKFFVSADVSSLRKLPKTPISKRTFYGGLSS